MQRLEQALQAPSLQFGRLDGAFEPSSERLKIPMEISTLRKIEMTNAIKRGLVAAGVLAAAASANAAAINVESVVTDISAQAAPIALIGGAVLIVYVGIKAFRWVRSSLS